MSLKYKVISSRVISSLLAISLSLGLFGCDDVRLPESIKDLSVSGIKNVGFDGAGENLSEVAPPQTLVELDRLLESSQPQVSIISPRPQTTLQNVNVVVDLELQGYSLFKDKDLELGPHLSLILDNEPYQDIYDLAKPIVLENLKPGTHHLSVLAEKPWSESFKNPEAFAQTTFNILTETQDDVDLPHLIYNQPNGVYQAEPILVDFYVAGMEPGTWQVRTTINDEKFLLEQMQPTYLKGFQEGNNLVQLELLDGQGKVIDSKSNQPIRLITYEPNASSRPDTMAKLVSGQISFDESVLIVDRNYRNVPEPVLDEEISIDAPTGSDSEDLDRALSNQEREEETVSSSEQSLTESEEVIFDRDLELEDSSLKSPESMLDENLSGAESFEEDRDNQDLSSLLEAELSEVEKVETAKVSEQEILETSKQAELSKTESSSSGVGNSAREIELEETESRLLSEDSLQPTRSPSNSVSTNSVSEKIRALTENHPESLVEISPLPTDSETSSEVKPLDLKSEAESISQAKIAQVEPIETSQSSLSELEKIAIANEVEPQLVDQTNMIDSPDSGLVVSPGLNVESVPSESSKPNRVKFEEIKSKISSTLAVWLPKISGAWQQFSQQATSLIDKAVTALRANFSAS